MRFILILTLTLLLHFADRVGADDFKIKIGTNTWIGYEYLYFLRDREPKLFSQIDLERYKSASEVLDSYVEGKLHVAALTLDEALRAIYRQKDSIIYFVTNSSDGADAVFTRDAEAFKDLLGEKIAVETSGVGKFLLHRALMRANLSLSDFTIVNVPVDQQKNYLISNPDIAGVVSFPPFSKDFEQLGYEKIFSSRDIPLEILDVLIVDKSFYMRNHDAFHDAFHPILLKWLNDMDDIQRGRQDIVAWFMSSLNLSKDEVTSLLKSTLFPAMSIQTRLFAERMGSSTLSQITENVLHHMSMDEGFNFRVDDQLKISYNSMVELTKKKFNNDVR